MLAAGLPILQLAILLLESPSILLRGEDLLHEGPLPLLILKPAREKLGGTFDDRPHLAVFRSLHLAAIFLVMSVRVEHIPHLEQLKVALELGREIRAWKIVPVATSRGLLRLRYGMSVLAPIWKVKQGSG